MTPLALHRERALACRACPRMVPPPVIGPPVYSPIYLVGQAPGPREASFGRPFAWTAGRTLFRWFGEIGVDEATFRERAYMAAVCRCFPGRGNGGDRVPAPDEIERCSVWIADEVALLRPRLVLAVGKLAITRVAGHRVDKLDVVVGPVHTTTFHGAPVDWIALPHPSGLSAWPKIEPGRSLLRVALENLARHPVWTEVFGPG